MAQYKTPGVYVEESNAFGSSIVANATAVPVFMGFTEKMTQPNGDALSEIEPDSGVYVPVLISSMLEYEQSFGLADTTGTIEVTENYTTAGNYYFTSVITKSGNPYTPGFMHPSIDNYFANGGGSCYIVSLGTYDDFDASEPLSNSTIAIIERAIEQAEQSTLILPTDLIRYGTANYYNWCNQFIDYCEATKKLFSVLDVIMEDPTSSILNPDDPLNYREGVTSDFLKYAACYYPYLKSLSIYAYNEDFSNVTLNGEPLLTSYSFNGEFFNAGNTADACFTFKFESEFNAPSVSVEPTDNYGESGAESTITIEGNVLSIRYGSDSNQAELTEQWAAMAADYPDWTLTFVSDITSSSGGETGEGSLDTDQLGNWLTDSTNTTFPFSMKCFDTPNSTTKIITEIRATITIDAGTQSIDLADGKLAFVLNADQSVTEAVASANVLIVDEGLTDYLTVSANSKYGGKTVVKSQTSMIADPLANTNATVEEVKNYLSTNYINMPASPFMAGIYSRLDNASGVWTPPANVAPTGVSGPLVNLTSVQQEDFNVDSTSGKSIDAIRSFTGKGTLVWGARTNDGNSMDWRYINVVRLFISMETDISKALEAYVFKANVHNTWVEVKTMIESYLFGLYGDGAFAGTTPETSYQVLIGVGETMTEEDVLNGYMRASIKVAPVRPAEFIVLTFSQMVGQ